MIPAMKPSIGRIVHYRLTAAQAESQDPCYEEGDVVPGIVTRVHETPDLVSLRLFPDSENQTAPTVRNVGQGDLPGEWDWPPRV